MRSMLIWASLALPFHSRQCRRSTSATITAFAATRAGSSADRPPAICARCCSRMPMWNQSIIGVADAGLGETAAQAGAAVGEGGQYRVFASPDGVEAAADQHFDVGIGFGDGAENLSAASRRFDIADPHLQMPLVRLTTADEG